MSMKSFSSSEKKRLRNRLPTEIRLPLQRGKLRIEILQPRRWIPEAIPIRQPPTAWSAGLRLRGRHHSSGRLQRHARVLHDHPLARHVAKDNAFYGRHSLRVPMPNPDGTVVSVQLYRFSTRHSLVSLAFGSAALRRAGGAFDRAAERQKIRYSRGCR